MTAVVAYSQVLTHADHILSPISTLQPGTTTTDTDSDQPAKSGVALGREEKDIGSPWDGLENSSVPTDSGLRYLGRPLSRRHGMSVIPSRRFQLGTELDEKWGDDRNRSTVLNATSGVRTARARE